jgi:acetyltransferase EpsM
MLTAIHVTEGQRVVTGDLLFTIETTKSTAEVTAEQAGFVRGLGATFGQTVRAGEIFCYLAESAEWTVPAGAATPKSSSTKVSSPGSGAPLPAGLRITQPALVLAQKAGLNLSQLPAGPLVTEKMVKELVDQGILTPAHDFRELRDLSRAFADAEVDPTALLIYGGGGHGKALIDLLRTLGTYHLAGVVDDGFPAGAAVMGLPVLGGQEALADLYARGVRLAVNAVGGIGNVAVRIKVFQTLVQAGFTCPAVVHPSAWVEPSASLAAGVQVFPHAYVGSEAQVGFGAIVNTGAIVSHECVLGECVNISPGAMLAGMVQVGDGALIGMGVTVNLQVQIGAGARVGNSATVKADVPPNSIVRAGAVFP